MKTHEFRLIEDGTWDEPHYTEECCRCGVLMTVEGCSSPCIDEGDDE